MDVAPDSEAGEWVDGLSCWPGGERAPWCLDWMARSAAVQYILRARRWCEAGQPIGNMPDLPPVVVDGVLTVGAEWDTITAEESRHR